MFRSNQRGTLYKLVTIGTLNQKSSYRLCTGICLADYQLSSSLRSGLLTEVDNVSFPQFTFIRDSMADDLINRAKGSTYKTRLSRMASRHTCRLIWGNLGIRAVTGTHRVQS
jgi:hypothetical protein